MVEPVAGRQCGTCAVCCTALKIDDPGLNKEAGLRCQHLTSVGCGVYEARPSPCRAFFCGWRYLPHLDAAWRPDRSGVLIGFVEREGGSALRLSTHAPDAIRQGFVVDFIVSNVARGVPIYFTYAPGSGHGYKTFLNERLAVPVKYGDRAKVLDMLGAIMAEQEAMMTGAPA